MDKLANRLAGAQATNTNQVTRGPSQAQYQNQNLSRVAERPTEQFPSLPAAARSQMVQAPPQAPPQAPLHAQYQPPPPNRIVERPSEQFPSLQAAHITQLPRGPPPAQYQSQVPNRVMERAPEQYPNPQAASAAQIARMPPPVQYQSQVPSRVMERPSEQFQNPQVATNSQIARMPPPAQYQAHSSNRMVERPSEQFPGSQAAHTTQLSRGPPPVQYQNQHPNRAMERPPEQFTNLQTANTNQLVHGPVHTQYQSQNSNRTAGRPPEQFLNMQSATNNQMARGAPPGLYQNPHINKPVERLSEPFPNIQTAKSSQTVRGPPLSHYSSIPNKPMEGLSEPFQNIQTGTTTQVARGPPLNNYQIQKSTKQMEMLSERLAEVKATDMIPTPLNPASPRKKGSASEVSTRTLETIAPLISWDNTPSYQTDSPPNVPVISWDADVMQLTLPKSQKEVLSSTLTSSNIPLNRPAPPKNSTETPLPDNNTNVVHPQSPKKNGDTQPTGSLEYQTMQAIINQGKKQQEAKLATPIDTKASVVPVRKPEPDKTLTSPVSQKPPEDHSSDKLKEFVQQQSMERQGLAKGGAKMNPAASQPEIALISFDDEPPKKTLSSGGAGVTPFIDINKVLVPTEKQAYLPKVGMSKGFDDEKKNSTSVVSETKGSFRNIDLLEDLLL
ncbi:hypothetical protein TWF718_008381 [Orbilia javanica]|uniref:Uncharacterized protein n=1 Tax=Orbilia javanica TaxID=47235 RepID=A0AAN8RD27_9PEZI